ncbi:MAG: TIGR00730 family Rossman fold protein [Rhodobacteraceae bacterium]|nr:TIGR00730 family Rossman fold protein [Paracoccaceae bacterium]
MPVLPLSVCVFCGARSGADPAFVQAGRDMGQLIAQRGWRLVYGAGDVGIMGEVARAAQAGGAPTFGVIPTHLMHAEKGRQSLSTLVVTETMHERKKVMFTNSDAIVVLPGGAGSLDEFFEVLTWRQLGLHKKPILLLNTNGYWTPLAALIDHVIEQRFAEGSIRSFFQLVDTVDDAGRRLDAYFHSLPA